MPSGKRSKGQGSPSQVRQHPGSDAPVVSDQIALGDSVIREQNFVWTGDLYVVAANPNCFATLSHGLFLPHYLLRTLIGPQPEKARLPELPGACPLGKADLGYELRLHPMHATTRQAVCGKWARFGLDAGELLA